MHGPVFRVTLMGPVGVIYIDMNEQYPSLPLLWRIAQDLDNIPLTAAARAQGGAYDIGSEREERGHASIDSELLSHTSHLLDFLHKVDEAKENIQPYSVEGMRLCVYRYEVLWLPFLKKHMGKENLSAPLDIAWAWLMHALAPSKYAKDLSTVLNINAEEICAPGPLYSQHLERTRQLWHKEYPGISFDPPGLSIPKSIRSQCHDHFENGKSQIKYDLVAAALRQQVFLYQVSLPHWRTKWFLERCVDRYRRFLLVRKENPREFLVPTFDIDLSWHAHMASHRKYVEQSGLLTGLGMFDHDDSVNNREAGGRLETSYQTTSRIWQEKFKEEYGFPGGMWRGPFPHDLISNIARKLGAEASNRLPPKPANINTGIDFSKTLVCGLLRQVTEEEQGSVLLAMDLHKGKKRHGTVTIRVPRNKSGKPACVLASDNQDRICAMARLIPPGYLAERSSDSNTENLPLQERNAPGQEPSFMIESCNEAGSSDWGIIRGSVSNLGAFAPQIFRCGEGFFTQEAYSDGIFGDYKGACNISPARSGTSWHVQCNGSEDKQVPDTNAKDKSCTKSIWELLSNSQKKTGSSFAVERKGDCYKISGHKEADEFCIATLLGCLVVTCQAMLNKDFL